MTMTRHLTAAMYLLTTVIEAARNVLIRDRMPD